MSRVFNSTFENTLRVLLLLNEFQRPMDLDVICAIDFLTVYGKSCGVTERDINGTSPYIFSEYASRRPVLNLTVNEMILTGLMDVEQTEKGFQYSLSEQGNHTAASLSGVYADEYRESARMIKGFMADKPDKNVLAYITSMASRQMRGVKR